MKYVVFNGNKLDGESSLEKAFNAIKKTDKNIMVTNVTITNGLNIEALTFTCNGDDVYIVIKIKVSDKYIVQRVF